MFWSEIGLGFGEPGGTPFPRIPRTNPLGAGVSSLLQGDVLRFRYLLYCFTEIFHGSPLGNGMNPVTIPATSAAAHHILNLLTELLVDQSIHNWVDCRVEHDYCGLRDIRNIAGAE